MLPSDEGSGGFAVDRRETDVKINNNLHNKKENLAALLFILLKNEKIKDADLASFKNSCLIMRLPDGL